MEHQGYFKRGTVQEATKTRTLIADLYRIVTILDVDIASEEQQTKVADLTRPEYPILARELRARRDNLLATIAELRRRIV